MINTFSLVDMGDGAVGQKFEQELEKVIENIGDEETDARAERSITLTLKFKPASDRNFASISATIKTKLADGNAVESAITIGTVNGKPNVAEYRSVNQELDLNTPISQQ